MEINNALQRSQDRIVWIDWAKAIGIMIVVFCHVPQFNTLEKQLLCSFQMPLFFYLSGYLHKVPDTWKVALKKYWKTLVIPYLLFQPIFYPYWLVQKSQQEGLLISNVADSFVKPFLNCFIGIPIDGITWFLVALLIIKIIADLIYRCRYANYIALLVCIISMYVSYVFNADHRINVTYAIDSMFDFLPFFFLGYVIKQYKKKNNINDLFHSKETIKYALSGVILIIVSLIIIVYQPDEYNIQRVTFYILGIMGLYFSIFLCRCIPSNNKIILTISKGTIILLGLHWMFIGTTNFFLEKFLHINGTIMYSTFEATVLVIAITLANYFIILFCERHFRIILGGR